MSEENQVEQAHHPYGPSRWPGLCVCTGYTPSKTPGEFAERGTAVHLAIETGDYGKLREEDREVAEWMTAELHRLTQGLETDAEVKTRIGALGDERLLGVSGVTGTCDRRWEDESGALHVADFKAFSKIGLNDYRAQLAGYILGCPRPKNEKIMCHVFHGGSRLVETFEMTWDECLYYAGRVVFAIENPFEARCRSQHCDHCAQAGDCPESAKVVAFGALAAGKLTSDMVRADPASAARLCDWLDCAAKRIEEARSIIEAVAKEGVEIADPVSGVRYGLQTRTGRAQIPPVAVIIEDMIDKDGVSRGEVMLRAKLSLKDMQELVGKGRAEEYAVRGEDVICFVRKTGRAQKANEGSAG